MKCFWFVLIAPAIAYRLRQASSSRLSRFILRSTTDDVAAEFDASVAESYKAPVFEIERRRNFAIISHPDAGKTTLTEKLLLFGGAIQDVRYFGVIRLSHP
jgi:hypothetical protein